VIEVTPFDELGDFLVPTKVCSGDEGSPPLFPARWPQALHSGKQCHYSSEGPQLPSSLVYPISKCKAFNATIPCPHQPAAFLRALGYGGCLALPVILPTRDCTHPWNKRLRQEWSEKDAQHIRRLAQDLHAAGFESLVGEDDLHCSNHSIVNESWWADCVTWYG